MPTQNGTPGSTTALDDLPGLDCGLCGLRTCEELAERLPRDPDLLRRCVPLSEHQVDTPVSAGTRAPTEPTTARPTCAGAAPVVTPSADAPASRGEWTDVLGRPFDFHLDHFPEDPGPREIILPHNPMITRELQVTRGDVLIGRPLGMSCGCPITHCGVVREVDERTGVITWCVTGPLGPRRQGFKDLGYYIAEAYEGIVTAARGPVSIGARYFFQPRMCMLQWRHSGLVNFINRIPGGLQVRLEGLWIG